MMLASTICYNNQVSMVLVDCYLDQNKEEDLEIDSHKYVHLIFDKEPKIIE